MRGPFDDGSLTRSWIIETIRLCRPNGKSGSFKKKSTVHLPHIRLNTRISCKILSVELMLIWNPNYDDGNSSTFIDMWNVNAVDVCVYPLSDLTASKKQLHCWLSMFKTQLLLMAVGVKDSVFVVDSRRRRTYLSVPAVGVGDSAYIVESRRRRPTFRCQQTLPSLMLKIRLFCTTNSQYIHRKTHTKYHFTNIIIHFYIYVLLLEIQTIVFQRWDERRIKVELTVWRLTTHIWVVPHR